MGTFSFITVRLGKDSVPEIQRICSSNVGVLVNTFTINVRCTQVPDNYDNGDYAFIWLGSDNNKGVPTRWKQGFRAVGRVVSVCRGNSYNDTSETAIEILYVFHDSINRMDILRCAPVAYYWCSSMPLIGIDDHANQTIRSMSGSAFASLKAFFSSIESVTNHFRNDIIQIEPLFNKFFDVILPNPQKHPLIKNLEEILVDNKKLLCSEDYRPYITAIKSKPFLLLAGISGTGKSRIVRELAKACWKEGDEEYGKNYPKNFCMVQVKPNWHDSSELIGYVSRVSGIPVFVAGDFLRFVAKAWENSDVPYFLCLDEMNLAPVEQYFAEYLSVVESRKCDENGVITTDPVLKKCDEQWYFDLTAQLTTNENIRAQFNKDGITIPQNLIVVGTVNMDETTFSFSRKVLDRAMTIEMNEVDLYGGLNPEEDTIGKLEAGNLIGTAVEGKDIYNVNKDVCDTALKYLETVNTQLEGTPFKVAYRTRNEFLLYVVNNLPYNKDKDGNELDENFVIARALDEITSMKILSRIEGDETKIGNLLDRLTTTVMEQLKAVSGKDYSAKKDEAEKEYSVSLAKLAEMKKRLESGYTSYWS